MLRIAKSRGFLWQILGVTNPEQIKQTLEFWRKRAARQLTNEDARQITVNMTQFFEILAEWDKRDRNRRSPKSPRRRSRKRA